MNGWSACCIHGNSTNSIDRFFFFKEKCPLQVNVSCKFNKKYRDTVIKVVAQYFMWSRPLWYAPYFSLPIWKWSLGDQNIILQVVFTCHVFLGLPFGNFMRWSWKSCWSWDVWHPWNLNLGIEIVLKLLKVHVKWIPLRISEVLWISK